MLSGHRIEADLCLGSIPKLPQVEKNTGRKAGMHNTLEPESGRLSAMEHPQEEKMHNITLLAT